MKECIKGIRKQASVNQASLETAKTQQQHRKTLTGGALVALLSSSGRALAEDYEGGINKQLLHASAQKGVYPPVHAVYRSTCLQKYLLEYCKNEERGKNSTIFCNFGRRHFPDRFAAVSHKYERRHDFSGTSIPETKDRLQTDPIVIICLARRSL